MDDIRAALAATVGAEYEITGELGGGGMSRVFVATDRALGRRVAIKVLGGGEHAVDAQRFRREILTSARLQHPHIVPVHSAGEVGGLAYFVMPFVEGVSLRSRLRDRGAMPAGEATRVLRGVAEALHYAHAQGIVHRDLKPDNIMLSGGSAVVLDFGVAKAIAAGANVISSGASDTLTGAGFAVGTPRYMAPEQAAADPQLDHRADLYSFGVVAFELLVGEAPFVGSASDVLRRHIAEEPPDIRMLVPSLPAPLVAIVRACLRKSPSERPQSAAVVLDWLDGVSTPLIGTLHATAPRTRPRVHPSLRGPWSMQAAIIPLVYIAAAAVGLTYLVRMAAQERIREGIVAAGVIGTLIGLPLAVAGGLLLRLVAAERGGPT